MQNLCCTQHPASVEKKEMQWREKKRNAKPVLHSASSQWNEMTAGVTMAV